MSNYYSQIRRLDNLSSDLHSLELRIISFLGACDTPASIASQVKSAIAQWRRKASILERDDSPIVFDPRSRLSIDLQSESPYFGCRVTLNGEFRIDDGSYVQLTYQSGQSDGVTWSIDNSEEFPDEYLAEVVGPRRADYLRGFSDCLRKLSLLVIDEKGEEYILPQTHACVKPGRQDNVYFIRDSFNGFVKIGYSKSPLNRFSDLAGGHPTPLDLIGVVPGTVAHEREAHRLWSPLRIGGEWFIERPELIAWFRKCLSENKVCFDLPDDERDLIQLRTTVRQLLNRNLYDSGKMLATDKRHPWATKEASLLRRQAYSFDIVGAKPRQAEVSPLVKTMLAMSRSIPRRRRSLTKSTPTEYF